MPKRASFGGGAAAMAAMQQRAANFELLAACEVGDARRAVAAVAAGASLCTALTPGGSAALHMAAFDGRCELASTLLKAGAPVDLRRHTEGLDTPLLLACQNGHTEVVGLLAAAGASVDLADEHGATPLFVASKNGHVGIIELLISKRAGLDTAAPAHQGNSPLAAAAFMGHATAVEALIAAGARLDAQAADSSHTSNPRHTTNSPGGYL